MMNFSMSISIVRVALFSKMAQGINVLNIIQKYFAANNQSLIKQ